MVDEPRDVAADRSVAAPGPVDAEDPDAAVLKVAFFASLAVGVVAQQLSGVVDDARIATDGLGGKDAVSMY